MLSKNPKLRPLSIILVVIIATSFLFISPTMTSTFASNIQPLLTATFNQPLARNNTGAVILEGATVIDGTGALPRPNTTIVINGSKIMYASNNTANNYYQNSSAGQQCN